MPLRGTKTQRTLYHTPVCSCTSVFTVVEDEDQKGFDQYEDILPLSTRHFYCLIEVPKAVTENDVSITIIFNGQEYIYHKN